MQTLLEYLRAFLVGGAFCAAAQILIDRTKLTPARILVGYVVGGVILGALGLYQPLVDFAGAGATVPLTGFGYTIARGVREAVLRDGLTGALTGGRHHGGNAVRSRGGTHFPGEIQRIGQGHGGFRRNLPCFFISVHSVIFHIY